MSRWTLTGYDENLAVVRLGPGTDVPDWATARSSIFSVTATAAETSIVCSWKGIPAKVNRQGPFTAFAVEGPLDFALTGVLSALLEPLAAAQIPVFTISTFDTDWILVPVGDADRATEEWRAAGHTVQPVGAGTEGSG